jgi:hypothetical protein
MEVRALAGLDLYGTVLRYAEVERYGGQFRLLRLGSCDFEYDILREVFYADDSPHLETIAEAIGGVLEGCAASQVRLVIHPPESYSFFTPLPSNSPTLVYRDRVRSEVELLTQQPIGAVHLAAEAARTETLDDGERVDWFHVMAIPQGIQKRLKDLLRRLPGTTLRPVSSMQGAAQAVRYLERPSGGGAAGDAGYALLVGYYPSHIEFSVLHQGTWYFSHHTRPATATDSIFLALTLIRQLRLSVAAFGRVYVYGVAASPTVFDVFPNAMGIVPERLDPMLLMDLEPGSLPAGFDVEAYVPCIGVAL